MATNSTSSVSWAHFVTASAASAINASAFLRWMYSMQEGLTAASTCRRTLFAPFAALQTAWMLSASILTGTASVLFFTSEAIDLMRKLSTLEDSMPSTSMEPTPIRSRIFTISSFSLKDRESALEAAASLIVMSLTRIALIYDSYSCERVLERRLRDPWCNRPQVAERLPNAKQIG